MRIFNFGSLNFDFVYRVPRLPKPGETIAASDYHRYFGGKGLNQSIAAARAGAEVFHAGKVGMDGGPLKSFLLEAGINVERILTDSGQTGHAIVYVDDDGANEIVILGGANMSIDAHDVKAGLDGMNSTDILVLQNEVSNIPAIIQAGVEAGSHMVFNPAPMRKEVLSYPIELISDLVLNESEGRLLTGRSDPEEILEDLAGRYGRTTVVLTLGSQGLLYADGSKRLRIPSYRVKTVDTTAAGDCFIGYYLAGLATGLPDEINLRRASRAAAICVTRKGAAESIPFSTETDSIKLVENPIF